MNVRPRNEGNFVAAVCPGSKVGGPQKARKSKLRPVIDGAVPQS